MLADLPSASRFGDFMQWPGREVLDAGGERLGTVEMIFLDDETNQPEWVRITLAGDEPVLVMVPLADASVSADAIRVAHGRDRVTAAPRREESDHLDQAQERALYDHYGLGYSEEESGSGLPMATGETPAAAPHRLRAYEATAPGAAEAAPTAAEAPAVQPAGAPPERPASETGGAEEAAAPPPVTAGAPPFTAAPDAPAPPAEVPAQTPEPKAPEAPGPTPPPVTAGAPPFTDSPATPPPPEKSGPRPARIAAAGGAVLLLVPVIVRLVRGRSSGPVSRSRRGRGPARRLRAARRRRSGRAAPLLLLLRSRR
jgi:outer membrane biosynthesis protein TonB